MHSSCQGDGFLLGFLLVRFLILEAFIGFPVSLKCTKASVFVDWGRIGRGWFCCRQWVCVSRDNAFLTVGLMWNPGCVVKHMYVSVEALILWMPIKTFLLWLGKGIIVFSYSLIFFPSWHCFRYRKLWDQSLYGDSVMCSWVNSHAMRNSCCFLLVDRFLAV